MTIKGADLFSIVARRFQPAGQVIVLHPDEEHDGGAGTDHGLQYRMLYLEPALLFDCLEAARIGLPFVDQPGGQRSQSRRHASRYALGELDRELDELFVDDFVSRVAGGLARHAGTPPRPLEALPGGARDWRGIISRRMLRGR